jgi:hypothetical protein
MSKPFRFGVVAVPLLFALFASSAMAQGSPPQEPPAQPAADQPVAAQPVVVSSTPPVKEPYVLEDGGLYFEPIYWLNRAQPDFAGGKTALGPGNFDFMGDSKASFGGEIGIPAGRSNTVRVTYFRIQGNTSYTLGQNTTILTEGYLAGDFINATYKTQGVKLSWDYLSYTWHKPSTAIHLKTLYEVQYVNTSLNAIAPFKPVVTDASGNTDNNVASGTKSVVLPTFGMAIGSEFGKRFRWDVRGSGFGLPHKGDIADVQGSIAVRLGMVELIVGDRFFHFKTSPNSDLYLTDTLQGVFGGLRFAWRGQPR